MAKGGARYGAGRKRRHARIEHALSIKAQRWQREGLLQPGQSGVWRWTDPDTGGRLGSVSFSAVAGAVVLRFVLAACKLRQRVEVERTACHFGGDRPWFTCPACSRRSAALYLQRVTGFACRKCADLAYTSQVEDGISRSWRKQMKAERRLAPMLGRPAGMHVATHIKVMATVAKCEAQRIAALARALGMATAAESR